MGKIVMIVILAVILALGSLPCSKVYVPLPRPHCGEIFQKRIVVAFHILDAEGLETTGSLVNE